MKKYLNKGLIYQWFNSAKMIILLGVIAWGFASNMMVESHIGTVSRDISMNFHNGYSTYTIYSYVILGVIFAMIHFMSQGINKRNNNMFLTSAPYTKKQIKYNELICLLINLLIFITIFIYMNIMGYFRYYDLMSVVDGYFLVLLIEVAKIFLFGTIGIFILLIVDSMFSNTIMGIICMISILPVSLIFILSRIFIILDYIPGGNGVSLLEKIGDVINVNFFRGQSVYLIDSINVRLIQSGKLISEFVVAGVIIAVLSVIYLIIQRKFKVESNTKMFTSKLNEKIIVIISSIGAGSFILAMLSEFYTNNLMGYYYYYGVLSGTNLIKALAFDIGIIGFISFVVYKLINKLLNNIQ